MNRATPFTISLIALLIVPAFAFSWGAAAPPWPIHLRMAVADCTFTGTVVKLEPGTTSALRYPAAKQKIEYQTAIVKVDRAFRGMHGRKQIRIGYYQVRGSGGVPRYRLPVVGEKALFFLKNRPDVKFFPMSFWSDFVRAGTPKDPGWLKTLAEVEKFAKLLETPMQGLKSTNAAVAEQTAAMLVMRYRTPQPGPRKEVAIDATESRLILQTLLNANWKMRSRTYDSPQSLFYRLGLTAKDGWQNPKNVQQFESAAKAWLTKNADSYRIRKFVSETN